MSDKSYLQVRPRDGDSSLSLSKARVDLVARGRRDADALAALASTQSEEEGTFEETRRLAEQSDADAQYRLGWMYESGLGVAQDYAAAVTWYRKAAEQGHPNAPFHIGCMYHLGRGIERNYIEAVKWYRKAAEHRFPLAPCNLGLTYQSMCESGDEAVKNCVQAHMWFNIAASWALTELEKQEMSARRDEIAARMNQKQVAEAEDLAQQWLTTRPFSNG